MKIGGVTPGTGVINVTNLGRVGIGTNAPASTLDVNGDFRLGVNTGGTAYSIGFTRTAGAQLYGTTSAGLSLGGDASGVDAVVMPDGNVGIGTASPAHKLDIAGGSVNIGTGANIAYRAGNYVSIGNMSYTNTPYIAFNAFLTTSDIATSKNLVTPTYNAGGGLIIRGEAGGSGLHFLQKSYANGTAPYDVNSFTDVLTLTSSGNLGIGTADTKGYKLAVNGEAIFTRVRVKSFSEWPDYVFQPEYKLPTLAEVEDYIKVNRHLPDVPSAKEVEQEGLDVGETDKRLMQKVEELTLYLIDQQKQLKSQQEQISFLQKQNEILLKRMEDKR